MNLLKVVDLQVAQTFAAQLKGVQDLVVQFQELNVVDEPLDCVVHGPLHGIWEEEQVG